MEKLVERLLKYDIQHHDYCDRVANGLDGDCRCGLFLIVQALSPEARYRMPSSNWSKNV